MSRTRRSLSSAAGVGIAIRAARLEQNKPSLRGDAAISCHVITTLVSRLSAGIAMFPPSTTLYASMSPETRRSKRALPSTTEVLTVGLRRSSSVAEHPSPRKSVSDGVGRPEKRARLFPEAAQVVSRAAESASLLTDGDNEHAEVRSTSSAFVKDIAPPASVQSVRTDATITARLGKFFLDPRDRQK